MPAIEVTADHSDPKSSPVRREGRFDPILARIDLAAILVTLVGISLLGIIAMVLAVMELAKLVSALWATPVDRWLILLFCAAIVWVIMRWKKSHMP